jgi:hypothetical protein
MTTKKKLTTQELNLKKQNRLNEAERLGVIAMIESGMPFREIARQTGRSVQTIWKLKENAKTPPAQVELIKKRLSAKLWERCDKAEDLLYGKLEYMSGRDLVGAIHYGIMGGRLMDDQSTANFAHLVRHDPEQAKRARELLSEIEKLREDEKDEKTSADSDSDGDK